MLFPPLGLHAVRRAKGSRSLIYICGGRWSLKVTDKVYNSPKWLKVAAHPWRLLTERRGKDRMTAVK